MSPRVGIMQGRLLPPMNGRIQAFPADSWPEEFPLARDIGFDTIEFIFDADGAAIEGHPLLDDGCHAIRALVDRHHVAVQTICADYFMRHPFHGEDTADVARSVELLSSQVENTSGLNITDIVIPCVDESTLSTADDRDALVRRLEPIAAMCEAAGVNLALETDLDPDGFVELLDGFASRRVTVNYDVGNSAALGYDPVEEWEAYGDKVSSVHIKDRVLNGATVSLGSGSARFDDFFQIASRKGYDGLFVLQAARGGDELDAARGYKQFLVGFLDKYMS